MFTVEVPIHIAERITGLAKARMLSASDIIRLSMVDYLRTSQSVRMTR